MEIPFTPVNSTIVTGCINRDRKSQKDLYLLTSPFIYSAIIEEGFDKTKAEEILQKVFAEIFNSIHTCPNAKSVIPWLATVSRRIINNAVEKGNRQPKMY